MTYLLGNSLSADDKARIIRQVGSFGLIIPKGVTQTARQMRKNEKRVIKIKLAALKDDLKHWQHTNPGASAEETKWIFELYKRHFERIKNPIATREYMEVLTWSPGDIRKFDWRDAIDIGAVHQQGADCNTCWAFAAIDAIFADQRRYESFTPSLRPIWFYEGAPNARIYGGIPEKPDLPAFNMAPSVQELLNCMEIEEKSVCRSGWHGRAFDFLVYEKGVPYTEAERVAREGNADLGLNETYRPPAYKPGLKRPCNPSKGFKKAAAWGYVKTPPDKMPTVEELQNALLSHGPLVMPITSDDCFVAYKSGIFNGNSKDTINHAVLLIGFDDEKKAWLIKNSWGEDWGEKGFGWVRYGSNNIGKYAAWIDL